MFSFESLSWFSFFLQELATAMSKAMPMISLVFIGAFFKSLWESDVATVIEVFYSDTAALS